jgi:hypothetical protein
VSVILVTIPFAVYEDGAAVAGALAVGLGEGGTPVAVLKASASSVELFPFVQSCVGGVPTTMR